MATQGDPLARYLAVQKGFDRELATILKDAAREASKMIEDLAPNKGVAAQVKRRQLTLIRRELLSTSQSLWNGTNSAIERGLKQATAAAMESAAWEDRFLFQALGDVDISTYQRAKMLQATRTVDAFIARGANGISLSQQVYKTKALADGWVDRAVSRAILLGLDARTIAREVSRFIRPDVPGGVSYAAFRLGRTELNNAFHTTNINRRKEEPWVEGMKWNLSNSHGNNDDCDGYASDSHIPGGDAGVFRPDQVPGKPHPNCLCFVTAVSVPPEEFARRFLDGEYADFMRDESLGAGLLPDF